MDSLRPINPENKEFVRKVRNVETLKSCGTISPSAFETGKYILLLKRECVCLDKNNKLIFRDFKEVENLKKFGNVVTTFLDIQTDSDSDVYLFAADLQIESDDDLKKLNIDGDFLNIRRAIFFLNEEDARIVHHARSLLHFHKTNQYCNLCGACLEEKQGVYQKLCPSCKFVHYPLVSPIGITLIEDRDHDEVLLVRQKRHPPGMYTCVAGFVEPVLTMTAADKVVETSTSMYNFTTRCYNQIGESLEENAVREVAEEVGVKIENVQYCVSQHWAAPSSQLILGCIGTAVQKDISMDEKELVDAKWVTADELKEAVRKTRGMKKTDTFKADQLWAPPSNAVSHFLMVKWLKKYHNFEAKF